MEKMLEALFNLRKELHENPELSYNEFKTTEIVLNFIEKYAGDSTLFTLYKPLQTAVVLKYSNSLYKPYKIFRTDMDALPVTECTDNEIVSKNQGVMHACGHDIHITVLCGLIAKIAELKPEKNFLFVFQPAEEGAGGAKKLLSSGFFDKFEVESAFALHVTDDYKVGEVASNGGILFAIPREVDIVFKGKSAHVAYSERGNDALAAAAVFLSSYKNILQKEVKTSESFLAHFGKISSTGARNIVSEFCKVEGTLRAFSMEVMEKLNEIVKQTAIESASKFRCSAEMKALGEYVAVKNSPKLFELLKKICAETGVTCFEKKGDLVGEDFGYFTQKWDGLLFWLGTREKGKKGNSLHSEQFFPSFNAVETALKIMVRFALS